MAATQMHEGEEIPLAETGTSFVTAPSKAVLEQVVNQASTDDDRTIRVLVDDDVFSDFTSNYLAAAQLADLIEAGVIEALGISNFSELHTPSVVFDGEAYALFNSEEGGVMASPIEGADDVYAAAERQWKAGNEIPLRVPGYTRTLKQFREVLSDQTAADFEEAVEQIGGVNRKGDIDETGVLLLVAARNEELLYDVGKAAEDINLVSKATVSRTKTELEDMGLIETERVPISVGRPRQRLLLGEEMAEETTEAIVSAVSQTGH